MRRRTRSRRFFAATGFATGSYMLGDDTTPASSADSAGVSSLAQRRPPRPQPSCWMPKYVRAADSIPYAPLPK